MTAMLHLGLIGLGNMGRALTDGFLASGSLEPTQLGVFTRNPDAGSAYAAESGCVQLTSAVELAEQSSAILIAVKPHQVLSVLTDTLSTVDESRLIISVAAGVTARDMADAAGPVHRIVRIMPNTPSLVGCGACGITKGPGATDDDLRLVESLFSSVGICITVDEDKLHAVTGVSGSGPAYVYMFIEALADGGVVQGLTRSDALKLAAQTVAGAAKMVTESDHHPAALRDAVASPGGTTIAAIRSLEQSGMRAAVIDAVAASAARSQELASND